MNQILIIAQSSWRTIFRMKVVYFLIICTWLLVFTMSRYEQISIGRNREMMLDMSVLLTQIATVLCVLSITFEIPKELREGIAATYLTKSLGRTRYLLGKMLGVWVVSLVICTLIIGGSFWVYDRFFPGENIVELYIQIQMLTALSVLPTAAIGIFFAVILPEMAAPLITLLVIWFASASTYFAKLPPLLKKVLPNLSFFDLKDLLIYPREIPWSYIGMTAVWGIAFGISLCMLTAIIFRFKDIK